MSLDHLFQVAWGPNHQCITWFLKENTFQVANNQRTILHYTLPVSWGSALAYKLGAAHD